MSNFIINLAAIALLFQKIAIFCFSAFYSLQNSALLLKTFLNEEKFSIQSALETVNNIIRRDEFEHKQQKRLSWTWQTLGLENREKSSQI